MPRRSAAVIAALPVVDLPTETRILAYHTGVESVSRPEPDDDTQEAAPEPLQQPKVGIRECVDDLTTDLWTALQQGVI